MVKECATVFLETATENLQLHSLRTWTVLYILLVNASPRDSQEKPQIAWKGPQSIFQSPELSLLRKPLPVTFDSCLALQFRDFQTSFYSFF